MNPVTATVTEPTTTVDTSRLQAQNRGGQDLAAALKLLQGLDESKLAELAKNTNLNQITQAPEQVSIPDSGNARIKTDPLSDLVASLAKATEPLEQTLTKIAQNIQENIDGSIKQEQIASVVEAKQILEKDGVLDSALEAVTKVTQGLSGFFSQIAQVLPGIFNENKQSILETASQVLSVALTHVKQAMKSNPLYSLAQIFEAKAQTPSPELN